MKKIIIPVLFIASILFAQEYNRASFFYNSTKSRRHFIQFYDPYSGKIFYKTEELEIDHIVPLKVAWDLGANKWTDKERRDFANDIENLILVSKTCNRSKSDKKLEDWLPQNKKFYSDYSNRYISIINKYHLK